MEKASGKQSIALSTVETGTENPGLELMVIHQFSFSLQSCGRLHGLL